MPVWVRRLLIAAALVLLAAPASPAVAGPALNPSLPGCTTFYSYDGHTALAGNNEDFNNPLTRVWFVPAAPGRFGCVFFGYEDGLTQGGVNDHGVFFDGLSLPYKASPLTSARPAFPGGELVLLEEVLAKSATVDDAVAMMGKWRRPGSEYSQLFLGDRAGHSVIIDGDTIVPKRGRWQLATNFRTTETTAPPYPDERFGTVRTMLEKAPRYDVALFRRALDAAHQEGDSPTLYSQVYELNANRIHLYQFHDFTHEVVLNLGKELAKGARNVTIASLFPKNDRSEMWAANTLSRWQRSYEQRISTAVDVQGLEWMCGDYVLGAAPLKGTATVYLEGNRLYLRVNDRPSTELFPSGPDTVFHQYVSGIDVSLKFVRTGQGDATGAQGRMAFDPYGLALPYDLVRKAETSPPAWGAGTIAAAGLAVVALVVVAVFAVRRRRTVRGD